MFGGYSMGANIKEVGMNEVMEMVSFKAGSGVSAEQLRQAAAGMNAWIVEQPGFRSRCLVGPDADGGWTDVVRWASLEQAKAAADAMMSRPEAGAFMAVVDPTSIVMKHADIAIAV